MRLVHDQPEARRYEVWLIQQSEPQPLALIDAIAPLLPGVAEKMLDCRPTVYKHLSGCLWADDETGEIEFILTGPDTPENCRDVGIGYDKPIPPAEERPFSGLTTRLRGQVRFVLRSDFAEEVCRDG